MPSNLYVTKEQLRNFAIADEADNTDVWELLSEAVSRLFDRKCEVSDGFFSPAAASATSREFRANGTRYLGLDPYISSSITVIDVDGTDYFEAVAADREYRETENFLLFDGEFAAETPITVTARWGFAAIPIDITLACIEMAIAMWRRKDMAFADLSGVSAAVVNTEFSPTFAATVSRYSELYSKNKFFA